MRNLMYRYSIIFFFLLFSFSCARQANPPSSEFYKNVPKVDFCDLPNHEDELIFVRGTYSGIDEYWALNSLKKCKNKLNNVDLDFYKDGTAIPERFQKLFDSAYSSYWNTFLIIEATGKYESKNPNGYGHLGSNKSRFIVSEFIDVEIVRRQ